MKEFKYNLIRYLSTKRSLALTGVMVLIIAINCFSQNANDSLFWHTNIKLSWSEFKAPSDSNAMESAETYYGVTNKIIYCGVDSAAFFIATYFEEGKSWTKTHDTARTVLLKHEQDHFDLGELYARKLRKAIFTMNSSANSAWGDFRDICDRYMGLLEEEQTRYDNETNHSSDKIKQAEWDEKIEKELKELYAYKNPMITIKFDKNGHQIYNQSTKVPQSVQHK